MEVYMKLPIDKDVFNTFINDSNIFNLTKKAMYQCLDNWHNDDPTHFIEDMRADYNTVLKTYHFHNEKVTFDKNFNFEPPLDSITCFIRITDEEDDCLMNYRAIFDYELNIIDDVVCP